MDALQKASATPPVVNRLVLFENQLTDLETQIDQEQHVALAARAVLAHDECRKILLDLPEGKAVDILMRTLCDPTLCAELNEKITDDHVILLEQLIAMASDIEDDELYYAIVAVLQRHMVKWEKIDDTHFRVVLPEETLHTLTVSKYVPFKSTITYPKTIDLHYDPSRRYASFTGALPLAHARIFGIRNHLATINGIGIKGSTDERWEVIFGADVHSWLIKKILNSQGFPPGTTELYPEVVWKLFSNGAA